MSPFGSLDSSISISKRLLIYSSTNFFILAIESSVAVAHLETLAHAFGKSGEYVLIEFYSVDWSRLYCVLYYSCSMTRMVQMWKDVFWERMLKDGNGTRHPVLSAEEYPPSARDDEREKSFYWTEEYFAQNKLIAIKLLEAYNLRIPFGLSG